MNNLLKILYCSAFMILFYGCDNDFREQNEEYKQEILKRKTNSFEYFKSTDEKIDSKLPRAIDFKKAIPQDMTVLNDYIKITSKVDSDDKTEAKSYPFG